MKSAALDADEQRTKGQVDVLRLMKGAAPERSKELEDLWERYRPEIEVVKDSGAFTINANARRIQFTPKSLETIWLLAFNGWRALDLYCPAIVGSEMLGLSIDEVLNLDLDRGPLEQDFRARIRIAFDWLEDREDGARWPDDVPRPDADAQSFDKVTKAAFDLTMIATAYVFLHELRHVIYAASGIGQRTRLRRKLPAMFGRVHS